MGPNPNYKKEEEKNLIEFFLIISSIKTTYLIDHII